MEALRADFGEIIIGVLITAMGIIAIIISFFRLRHKEFTLLWAGLFNLIYGIRWLDQIPVMASLAGSPFNSALFDTLLTYMVVIPFSAFLIEIFGRGFYHSMFWVFMSTLVYAVGAGSYVLINPDNIPQPAINPYIVILWCLIWAVNLIFSKNNQIEQKVLRTVTAIAMFCLAHDQIVNMNWLPWNVHIEHTGMLLAFAGMAFVTVHHIFANEKKLLGIEQEIEIAKRIQQSNLPGGLQSPQGLSIAARYIPMSGVAGDFYDFQIRDEKHVGILIADVSGHGVGAALIGSMLKIAYSSQVEHLDDPAKTLTEINRMLFGKIEDSFVTAFSIFIDLDKQILHYASAGHPPALLWNKTTREMNQSEIGGTILGPFKNSAYENMFLDISTGDRLLLYTDGIIETENKSGEFFGDDRLQAFIEAHADDTADHTADQLIDHLFKWAGKSRQSSLEDDLTLIIIDFHTGQ